jgi:hypothetical protein
MNPGEFTRDRYQAILRAGRVAGYRFSAFDEVKTVRSAQEKVCLLRHDCDNDLIAAARMAEIEADEGVSSTYFLMLRSVMYNLLAPPHTAMVRRILSLGHRLGLHFDESVVAHLRSEQVAAEVERERDLLRAEFGCSIGVVSFHQPGPRVLTGEIHLGCINTYSRADMEGFHYTSDSNLAFRGGEPSELFSNSTHPWLHILIHPEWWTETATSLSEKWNVMILNNIQIIQTSLLEREDTFHERRTVRIGDGKPDFASR